ncbi:MAG: SDR family NAD(P)-dependent oxidoreductase [Cyclobacteriaceae bacterium]
MINNDNYYTLITGASSGIGKEMAFECARLGQNLALVALPQSGMMNVVEEIQQLYKVKIRYHCLDLTKPEAPDQLLQWTNSHQIKINILINNVGTGYSGMLSVTPLEQLLHILYLNNTVMTIVTKLYMEELKSYGKGAYILNVGSLASFIPIPGKAIYSASKAFVLNFTLALRGEMLPSGVKVSCLCPGPVITSEELMERFQDAHDSGAWILESPKKVAKTAIKQLMKGKSIIYPSTMIFIISWLGSFLPGIFVAWVAGRAFKKIADKAAETEKVSLGENGKSLNGKENLNSSNGALKNVEHLN